MRTVLLALTCFLCAADAETLRAPHPWMRVDGQAFMELSPDDIYLYEQAIKIVDNHHVAKPGEFVVFLTKSDSPWTQGLYQNAGVSLEAGELAVTLRGPWFEDDDSHVVAVFWDRVLQHESPLAALIAALSRELHGILAMIDDVNHGTDHEFIVYNLVISSNVLRFLRDLPNQEGYYQLPADVRGHLNDYLYKAKLDLRVWQKEGRQANLCSYLLSSQDN